MLDFKKRQKYHPGAFMPLLNNRFNAIRAFFVGTTTWNEHYQRYETESETHTIYWIWLDEQAKKVLVISCFNI